MHLTTLLPLFFSLSPLTLALPSHPPISICGTAGFQPTSPPTFTSNFNSESFFLAGTAEKFNDALCRSHPGAITWVTLNSACRCRFYEDGKCEVEWGGSGGSLGQGPVERLGGWEGAGGYRCGWGYE